MRFKHRERRIALTLDQGKEHRLRERGKILDEFRVEARILELTPSETHLEPAPIVSLHSRIFEKVPETKRNMLGLEDCLRCLQVALGEHPVPLLVTHVGGDVAAP